ncbi:MAG: PfkB family carbohydrate kinase [Phycisphaerae bacterium]
MSDLEAKIVDSDGLLQAVAAARAAGKTIVQCHGCFDIVHPGHIRYLDFARQQGDVLVVSLTGDSRVSKGDQRPYIPQDLRAENLAALMSVDYVYIDPEPTAERVLARVRPDVYVKGREYEHTTDPGFQAEQRVVEDYGGRIIFSSGEIVFSSTKLLERMPASRELESHRLNLVCQRYGITAGGVADTLERFRNLSIVVVGDTVIDRYVFCDALGVASESPMLSLSQLDERSYVGGAAIVARHAAAMGAHALLLTAGGTDDASRRASSVLSREGVELHMIESRPTLVEKTRYLASDSKLFKVDRAQRHPLDSVAERRAALILEQQVRIADVVILCDFGYGMITGGLLRRCLPTLRNNARILSADISGGRGNLLHCRNVVLLCPTEREARLALNDYDSGLSAVAWELLHRTQARHLVVTLEKRGMVAFERPTQDRRSAAWSGRLKSEPLPSFSDHAVDRLGCGDALLAAMTLSLAAGDGLMQAAYIGSAAAAIELGIIGNVPVEAERLNRWLATRPELAPRTARPRVPYAVG